MSWAGRTRWGRQGLAGLCLLVAGALRAEQAAMPVEDLRLPIELHTNGVVKTQLRAATAVVPPEGAITGTGVQLESFDEQGQLEGSVKAASCRFDRAARTASSDGPVEVEQRGVHLSGTGFQWNGAEQRVTISHDVKVRFRRNLLRTLRAGGESVIPREGGR